MPASAAYTPIAAMATLTLTHCRRIDFSDRYSGTGDKAGANGHAPNKLCTQCNYITFHISSRFAIYCSKRPKAPMKNKQPNG